MSNSEQLYTQEWPYQASTRMRSKDGQKRIKWTSLLYKGPVFPPAFQPLPASVTLGFKGKPIKLTKNVEECAILYLINRKKVCNAEQYDKNFWKDWREIMMPKEKKKIHSLEECDFSKIENYIEKERFEETRLKKMRKFKEMNSFCIMDGKKVKVKNPMVEPLAVFVGEGDHPLNGKIKPQTTPEMVTVNCSNWNICKPPEGHMFKEFQHNNKVLYLAYWHDAVLDKRKYIEFDASSLLKMEGDRKKYEVARKLHQEVEAVRNSYASGFSSKNVKISQSSLALYLIDRFCLRPGYQKREGFSAETKGCCLLTRGDIHLSTKAGAYFLQLKFIAKSWIPFERKRKITKAAYRKLEEMIAEKEDDDNIFNSIEATFLNNYLKGLCKSIEGVTLKTFRTHHACTVFEKKLQKIEKKEMSLMIKEFNEAVEKVASLCNHTDVNTTKEDYIDPRITVAWCLKWDIPIKRLYNPYQQKKFQWAIKANDTNFIFAN